jgi:hypothetical protein
MVGPLAACPTHVQYTGKHRGAQACTGKHGNIGVYWGSLHREAHASTADTPYQGEDLIYDSATPEGFLVRCSRNSAGPMPGICLYTQRIEHADILVRFPRDWLTDWSAIEVGLERLIEGLRPRS